MILGCKKVTIHVKREKPTYVGFLFYKWYLQESNQGHTDFQSVALPSELRYPHQTGNLRCEGRQK